jgi:ELP3 family radical SAM enzyme/protein acetyltransferase
MTQCGDIEDIIMSSATNAEHSATNAEHSATNAEHITKNLFQYMSHHYSHPKAKHLFIKKFNELSKKYRVQIRKSDIVKCYRDMVDNNELPDEPLFWKHIQKKPVRNTSGVNPITLMYSPYPNGQAFTCRYKCKYCQTHPDYPKSYGPEAPASSRGIANDFDAIRQMNSNLNRLYKNGHELDKLEMNYEGGTFSEIPRDYIIDFHRDTYYAANTFFDSVKRDPLTIDREMSLNETAQIRIIGMTIETRPDTITADELVFFRKLGVTRVQMGVQHTNNTILKKSARGHTYEDAIRATQFLKTNGFKVVHHYMIALPYATPQEDMIMLREVYASRGGRPHEIKIYPYSVVDYSGFKREYEEGKFTLYSDENPDAFRNVMKYALEKCPLDIRICRAVRDIPTTYILGGCSTPNLRQLITDSLEKEGKECNDMRSREISRRDTYLLKDAVYYTTMVNECDTQLTLESKDRRALFGFLRLRLNTSDSDYVFPELRDAAIIEELHVYSTAGMLVKVGNKKKGATQHCGVGTQLLKNAEWLTWRRGYKKIAVIAGEGVRKYYLSRGYQYYPGKGRFMIKDFTVFRDTVLKICRIISIVTLISIITLISIFVTFLL